MRKGKCWSYHKSNNSFEVITMKLQGCICMDIQVIKGIWPTLVQYGADLDT
jgi:hypothetical protein